MEAKEFDQNLAHAIACDLYQRGITLYEQACTAQANEVVDEDATRALESLVAPGLYEHFKSSPDDQKFYAVMGVVFDVNDDFKPLVSYAALYAPHAGRSAGRELLHTTHGFLLPVVRPDDPKHPWVGPRFRMVRSLSREGVGRLWDQASDLAAYTARKDLLDAVSVLLW